ncbi:MAG: B12-binding domain-containing radical SAM protein [Deltaproteobacteria bacterium]|nr:B12-binding domain-containing radical SAM protein [Deltaproteobacteria bacterium]
MSDIVLIKAGVLDRSHPLVTPPLGIMSLAAVARAAGHRVSLIDAKVENLAPEAVLRRVAGLAPQVVGVSGFSNEWESFETIGRLLKENLPRAVLLGGGPHATSYPDEIMARAPFDYLALGEAEETFVELLDALAQGGEARQVPGLVYRENGAVRRTAPRAALADLDRIPFPAYDLIDLGTYSKLLSASAIGRRRYMSILTSRGCPYHCTYCHSLFGKRFRARSPDRVVEELTLLRERYGIRDIEVTDDIFNFDRDRVMELCRRVMAAKLDLRLSFPNGLRADRVDPEMIDALRRAGTVMISYAVETASPRLQKLIRKNLDLDHVSRSIAETVRAGIFTTAYFMLGFPTETEEEMLLTAEYAARSPLHAASFFIVTPFKGTELWNLVPPHVKELAGRRWFSFHHGYVNLSQVSNGRLVTLRRRAYRRFCLSPRRIARTFYRYPDKREFFHAVGVLARLFLARSAFAA